MIKILLLMAVVGIPSSQRAEKAIKQNQVTLKKHFEQQQLTWGAAVHIRIYKATNELEVWVAKGAGFELFKNYPICTYSGKLGPKQATGDLQSPEGFYFVKPAQLNPWSQFHLSFNLGYPNAYDRSHGRTGSALMVHGDCVSIGCYAMTDALIEEIYTVMVAAFEAGQPFIRVHAFPFRMTADNMRAHQDSNWLPFWQNLKAGYDYFEQHNRPPNVEVAGGKYVFD